MLKVNSVFNLPTPDTPVDRGVPLRKTVPPCPLDGPLPVPTLVDFASETSVEATLRGSHLDHVYRCRSSLGWSGDAGDAGVDLWARLCTYASRTPSPPQTWSFVDRQPGRIWCFLIFVFFFQYPLGSSFFFHSCVNSRLYFNLEHLVHLEISSPLISNTSSLPSGYTLSSACLPLQDRMKSCRVQHTQPCRVTKTIVSILI